MQIEPQSRVPEISMMTERRALQSFAAVAALITLISIVFWQTSASMVAIWARSDTFAHAFLVVPTVLWLVWRSRARLAALEVRPRWTALIALVGTGFAWLTGELASALALTQWAMVLMIPLAVLALFGWRWLQVLAMPLAFLFFAVPFGEAFVPTLVDWTADFTVAALAASGVPVFREGVHFVIPSGRWSVVEACSGIRYLIVFLVVGFLYAWTMYRSPLRRGLFIAAAIFASLVANWFRAYLIVMIGHLTDNRLGVGVDHLLYGWLFFGVVVALMFQIGALWREDDSGRALADERSVPLMADSSVLTTPLFPSVALLVATAALIAVWPVARDVLLEGRDRRPVEPAKVLAASEWSETSTPVAGWTPVLEGPARTQVMTFSRDGSRVTVFIGYYRDQQQGRELVNSMNRLVPDRGLHWKQVDHGGISASIDGKALALRAATLLGEGRRVRVWHWYWIDGQITDSDVAAKLSLAFDRLLGRTDTSAWIAVFTAGESDANSDQTLAAFLRGMGPAMQSALSTTAAR